MSESSGFSGLQVDDRIEFGDGVDFTTHGDIGHALQNDLDHHGHGKLLHQLPRLRQRGLNLVGVEHAYGLAAQPFGHLDEVDTVTADFGRVDVVERELHAEVHIELALALADETEVGVVDHDVDVGQLELRAHCQLLDEKLEVVVAGNGHHVRGRIGHAHAERSGHGPAQRARLAGVDPVARLFHLEQLRRRDLRQADGGDVARVGVEKLDHLLVNAVGLDGNLVVVPLAQQGLHALAAGARPGAAVFELARRLAIARHGNEQFERRLGVGGDAEIGHEHPADLRGLDVHMQNLAALGIHLGRAGVAVGPAVADAQHQVGSQQVGVAATVRGLQTDHARHQRMAVANRAPAHQRGNHRHAGQLGELHQQIGGIGIDHAAAGDDQRALGRFEHVQRLFNLRLGRRGLVHRQRRVGVGIEFDFGELNVQRQIDQHRPGTARAHHMERLLKHLRHQRGLAHGDRPLAHRLGNGLDIHRLKVFLVQPRARGLAGDAQNGNGVGNGRIQPGDHVGTRRAGSADAHADMARRGAGVALSHMRRRLDVARQHMRDVAVLAQRGIQRVDRRTRHTEGLMHAFFFEH